MIFFAEKKTANSSHKLKTYGFSRLNNIKFLKKVAEKFVGLKKMPTFATLSRYGARRSLKSLKEITR